MNLSAPIAAKPFESAAFAADAPAIVVGGGPCGVRAAQELSRRGRQVILISAEAIEPYNRIKLTPLLAGDVQIGDIRLPADFPGPGAVQVLTGLSVVRINPEDRSLVTADGSIWRYGALVLATGSRAHLPNIPGVEREGVFVFRSAGDAAALIARSLSAREVVVIGGGLLGLEAARGMRRRGARVTVVEHENRLMPRQLDADAAADLAARIAATGVKARTGEAVAEIVGDHKARGVKLRGDEILPADTVIVCTGVRAVKELAEAAGLRVGRGVVVDAAMRASAADVYAVGECAELDEQIVGLAGPGLEQAEVAAKTICGETARFAPGAPVAKLKLVGVDVFSIGPIEQLDAMPNIRSHAWRDAGGYRRIFISRGRLAGALAVGPWDEASRVQAAVNKGAVVYPWMVARFRKTGRIWTEQDLEAADLPAAAVVCNCTGVTAGRIRECAAAAATPSIEEVRLATGANTVCGTCGPLVEELLDANAAPKPVRFWKPLLAASAVAAAVAAVTVGSPPVPIPDTYGPTLFERLWVDGIWKQWSGFVLLGLTLTALAIGLRKRLGAARWAGGYDWWRLIHIALGVVCTLALFAHTGFRFGANLNSALMAAYAATLVLGAVAGLATGGEHRLRAHGLGSTRRPPRKLPVWLHILAIWPLPLLLAAHVASVYAY